MKKLVGCTALILGCLMLVSCVSNKEFEALKKKVDSMESQLAGLGFVETIDEKETEEKDESSETSTREVKMADQYEIVEFQNFLRNPDDYIDKKVQLAGEVSYINDIGTDDWPWHVTIIVDDSDKRDVKYASGDFYKGELPVRLLRGDSIVIYGVVKNYNRNIGSSNAPTMTLDYIEYDGTIYDVSHIIEN